MPSWGSSPLDNSGSLDYFASGTFLPFFSPPSFFLFRLSKSPRIKTDRNFARKEERRKDKEEEEELRSQEEGFFFVCLVFLSTSKPKP